MGMRRTPFRRDADGTIARVRTKVKGENHAEEILAVAKAL